MPTSRVPPRPMRMYLREWRKSKNMTQDELADLIGTNKGQISKLETGFRDWDQSWIQKIATALKLQDELHLFQPPETVTEDGLLAGLPENLRIAIMTVIVELQSGRR